MSVSGNQSDDIRQSASQSGQGISAAKSAIKTGKKAYKAVKGAKTAASSGGLIAFFSTPPGWIVLGVLLVFLFLAIILSNGMPSTTANSTSHHNPHQDVVTADEESGEIDDLTKSYEAETEAVNIMANALTGEKEKALKEVERICAKVRESPQHSSLGKVISTEATLQFLEADFMSDGTDIFTGHTEGYFTQEELEALMFLEAYNIAVDNLWDAESGNDEFPLQDGNGYLSIGNIETSKDANKNAESVFKCLVASGYSKQCAAGICGNIWAESGFRVDAIEGGSGEGFGICQWSFGRKAAVKAYCKKHYGKTTSLKGQVEYLMLELDGKDTTWGYYIKNKTGQSNTKAAVAKYKKMTNIGRACEYFCWGWERPNKALSHIDKRIAKAKEYYNKFKSVSVGASEGNASGGGNAAARQAAADWAKKIANDNSFTYGKSPAANHFGCYFCKNQGTKKKHAKRIGVSRSYEKTYCCNPFVTAAYVHGAKDPLLGCSNKKGIGLKVAEKKKCGKGAQKNFKWMGHIPKSELIVGDIILTNSHAKIVTGKNKQAEATGGKSSNPWGPNTIHECKLSYPSDAAVMRYIGSGGSGMGESSGVFSQTYSSINILDTYGKSDMDVAAKIKGPNSGYCPQSFAYIEGETFAVAYSNTTAGDTSQYIYKYNGSSRGKTKKLSLGHANGLTYNDGKLYSVRGSSSKCVVINAESLKKEKTINLPVGTSGIAFDKSNSNYYLSSGSRIRISDSNLKKVSKTINKKGEWRWAQDVGGGNGLVFACVSINKNGNNRVDAYDSSTGDYKGSIKVSFGEIEGCDVDENGYMYIMVNHRGTGTDYIYKTKTPIASGAGNSHGDGTQIPWRENLGETIVNYFADDNHKFYNVIPVTDQFGNPIVDTGVIDTTRDLEGQLQDDADLAEELANSPNTPDNGSDNRHRWDQEARDAAAEGIAERDRNERQNSKPKLSKEKYVKVKIEKVPISTIASNVFGLSGKDVVQLYGKNNENNLDDILRNSALHSLALMHDMEDPEEQFIEKTCDEAMQYVTGKSIGKFKVVPYCTCGQGDCKKTYRSLFGTNHKAASRTKGVSCAVTPDIAPIGTILEVNGSVVIVDEYLDEKTVKKEYGTKVMAIYCGHNHRRAEKLAKIINDIVGDKKANAKIVSKLSEKDARAYGGFNTYSGAGCEGAIAWGKKICDDQSFVYVDGWGKCHFCNGSQKAYVCTTFVKACYAHGANDSEMKKWCKNNTGGMVADLHSLMKNSSHWKSVGKIPISQMKKGDVIVFGKSHVEIYYGDGKYMGAHHTCPNSADDINYKTGWGGYTDVMRYLGGS